MPAERKDEEVEALELVEEAYDRLRNADKRKEYDELGYKGVGLMHETRL